MTALDIVHNGLMKRYKERVPQVGAILDAMVEKGIIAHHEDVQNDHIAFRTLGVPHLGVQSFEKIFLHYGYEKREYYYFAGKKLDAIWYAPPTPAYPRIFVSELRVRELSQEAQAIIHKYTNTITADPVDSLDLDNGEAVDAFLHTPLWTAPSWAEYQQLMQESEYAAWVIYNRYYLNHFTISIHSLPEGYNTVDSFNAFLEESGFVLNNSGGKTKRSNDGLLLQSSTVAQMVDAHFEDGDHRISGSYVEFAERRVLPPYRHLPPEHIQRSHRREGFEAGNADKIFESTYTSQTQRQS